MTPRILLAALLFIGNAALFGQAKPLPNAHAHNDYEHAKPLINALKQGFTSVEADVHLIDGVLYVSHDRPSEKNNDRTLESLYLEPLQKIVEKNGGWVYPNYSGAFYLMIDVKTEAEPTYRAIHELLKDYTSILTTFDGRMKLPGPCTVFISGNRAKDLIRTERFRLVGVDGRPSDIGKGFPADLMPVISDNFKNHLNWNGQGNPPEEQLEKLRSWIGKAHQEGKKVRLWASPEQTSVWEVLLDVGVDFLNTDQLKDLKKFLLKK